MKQVMMAILLVASLCYRSGLGRLPARDDQRLGASIPRVDGAGRVEIRIKAPDATKVRLNFWSGPKEDMVKQADGFWTLTTPPLAPGLHYYTLILDGAEVTDLGSHAFFRRRQARERGRGPGARRRLLRHSSRTHGQCARGLVRLEGDRHLRHALVYPPPDYDAQTRRAIRCSTLQHGGGRGRDRGSGRGARNFILDTDRGGSCKPMIVVMAYGYARRAGQPLPT